MTKSVFGAASRTSIFIAIAALPLLAACGGKEKDCTPDFTAVEQQRVTLCNNRECGDVAFKDDIRCGRKSPS